MPVEIVKSLSWTQDISVVKLRLELHESVKLNTLDIFTHAEYLKLNSPPFYKEFYLQNPIDPQKSNCKISGRVVSFKLHKVKSGLWSHFEVEDCTVDRFARRKRKEQFVADTQQCLQGQLELRAQQKETQKRNDMMLEIDRRNEQNRRQEFNFKMVVQDVLTEENVTVKSQLPSLPRQDSKTTAIRSNCSIVVSFTNRAFPTPTRESQQPLESEWLAKQEVLNQKMGFVDEAALRAEERNPEWLLCKGNEFFAHKNYLSSISAYSAGIRLLQSYSSFAPELEIKLYLNRSVAQLGQENYSRCIEDCTRVLDRLAQLDDKRNRIKIQCLARRGAALCKLQMFREGLIELQAAWELDRSNEDLKQDVMRVERILKDIDDEEQQF